MSEPIAALVAARSVLNLYQASKQILRLRDQQHNVRQLELDVHVSLQKFDAWQKTWFGDEKHPDVSGQVLWGVKGWTHIHRMLDGIGKTSRSLADDLNNLRKIEETNPGSRWRKAFRSIQAKQGPSLKMLELQKQFTALTRAVDELWIYSETVFDSLHPVSSLDSKVPERDRLLHTALRSRPCSLELYSRCSTSRFDCSLEMNLFNSVKAPSTSSEASPLVIYHLADRTPEAHGKILQMAIESVEPSSILKPETEYMILQKVEDLQLFHHGAERKTVLVKVAARGSAQFSYLRIPQEHIRPMSLESGPESLAQVLARLQSANPSMRENLSISAKVGLAFKVVECGFFLLGTPWFASLSSKNLLRLKSKKKAHHSFCLGTQTLDLDDLLFDDPSALAEASQLFRLGVLLMEIALAKPDLYSRSDETEPETYWIHNLPLVEQSMGTQYCRATAFCLQCRQSGTPFKARKMAKDGRSSKDKPFQETEKYEDDNFDDWQDYLEGLLRQYYSQVYMRLQGLREGLREVDSESEQRSVKS